MQPQLKDLERRTATDLVFEKLQEDIVSLKLLPGAKLSEVEVAEQFGVSRQPVRDAFNRLCNLDLLLIRPQKATIVRGFSMDSISRARFIRMAVEIEVIRHACEIWDDKATQALKKILKQQKASLKNRDWELFHRLDFDFHATIYTLSDRSVAIDIIKECRQKTDRLCTLGFGNDKEIDRVIEDHSTIIEALDNKDVEAAMLGTRLHLSRLDAVIGDIQTTHADYFE